MFHSFLQDVQPRPAISISGEKRRISHPSNHYYTHSKTAVPVPSPHGPVSIANAQLQSKDIPPLKQVEAMPSIYDHLSSPKNASHANAMLRKSHHITVATAMCHPQRHIPFIPSLTPYASPDDTPLCELPSAAFSILAPLPCLLGKRIPEP